MTITDNFLLELIDSAGGPTAIEGHCQKCGDEVRFLVNIEDGKPMLDSVADDGAGMKFYPYANRPEFLCGACIEAGEKLGSPVETYSRVVGYLSPVRRWNRGKRQEKLLRKDFDTSKVHGGNECPATIG